MKNSKTILVGILLVALTAVGMSCGSGGSPTTPNDEFTGDPAPPPSPDPVDPVEDPVEDPSENPPDIPPEDPSDPPEDPSDPPDDPVDDPCPDMDNDGICDDEDPDADGDGFTGDGGDCDDLNPSTFPGAPDKPDHPNYTDSNCDGVDGALDSAFWVSTDGSDTNPGTIDQPFLTVWKGINEAKQDLSDVKDVYLVEGTYNEDASLDEGVGLYGGFGPLDNDNLRPRDIDAHLTEYDCFSQPFFIIPSTTGQESVIEGMTFVGQPNTWPITIVNSSPTLKHNKIFAVDGTNFSIAVYIWVLTENVHIYPIFQNNIIQSADGLSDGSVSIALAAAAVSMNSLIDLTLDSNSISSGDALAASVGVHLLSDPVASALLTAFKNDIEAGSGGGISTGIMLGYDVFTFTSRTFASAEIYQNRIYGGHDSEVCVGVAMTRAAALAKLTNNFITGGHISEIALGVAAYETFLIAKNNSINAGVSFEAAIAIYLEKDSAANIDNNILYAEGAPNRFGVYEETSTTTTLSLRNNLFDNTLNVKYKDFTLGDILNIAAVNTLPDIATIGDNIAGDAGFADLADRDYHLSPDSDAINTGMDFSEVGIDIDEEDRPEGEATDIGADEFTE